MKKKISLFIIFIAIIGLNILNVHAETYSYGYAVGVNEECKNEVWTPENYNCVVGNNQYVKWVKDALIIEVDDTIKNEKDVKRNFIGKIIDSIFGGDYYYYDELNEYYSVTGSMPRVIVSCTVMFLTDGTTKHYYYPGDFAKTNDSSIIESTPSCTYYALTQNENLNACIGFDAINDNLENIKNQYGCDSQEFKAAKEKFLNYCTTYIERSGYVTIDKNGNVAMRECAERCKDKYTYVDNICSINNSSEYETNSCGLTKSLVGWFLRLLKIVRYIVPAIAIVLTILDYVTAILSSNDDAFKKAGGKFGKRLIIIVILFLLPVLLQFFFDVFNIPGLDSKNPFCMKK